MPINHTVSHQLIAWLRSDRTYNTVPIAAIGRLYSLCKIIIHFIASLRLGCQCRTTYFNKYRANRDWLPATWQLIDYIIPNHPYRSLIPSIATVNLGLNNEKDKSTYLTLYRSCAGRNLTENLSRRLLKGMTTLPFDESPAPSNKLPSSEYTSPPFTRSTMTLLLLSTK
jgi:hypothetical protein